MGKLLRILVLACVVDAVGAQGIFKGFTPDNNETSQDAPTQKRKFAPRSIIKDCLECPEMVVLPGGSFLMGADPFSNLTSHAETPQHRVQIQSFAIGTHEVTQEQWYDVMGNNPSNNKGRTRPVENVSWDEIQQLIAKLSQKTGQKYRLPSEAEWEYAARAGTSTQWSFGDDESTLGNFAWYYRNSGRKTQPVGQKQPNAFGLFDMYGNVWESTQDCWHETYAGAPTDGSAWTWGCSSDLRVFRGGAWWNSPSGLRSFSRLKGIPDIQFDGFGLRLARDL